VPASKCFLVDSDILIFVSNIQFHDILVKLSSKFNWVLLITPTIKSECSLGKVRVLVDSMIRNDTMLPNKEESKEVALIINELSKRMMSGGEIELFAIAEFRKYNILTHDKENTNVYFASKQRGDFWVYNLYHILYLACKAGIFSIQKIDLELKNANHMGVLTVDSRILKCGFKLLCDIYDENIERYFDPADISILREGGFLSS
jgi:hypothetical protein